MKQPYFIHHALWIKKHWKNILKVVLVLLVLSDGAWMHQHRAHPHAYAAMVSPQAIKVYGQPNLTSNTQNNGGVTATSLGSAYNVAVDSNGNLYISDCTDNRVLYYAAGTTTATRVYGQNGSFTSSVSNNNGGGVTGSAKATNLSCPKGLGLDSSGNLYVSDYGNHRVLYYTPGSTIATRVYGQPDLTSSVSNNNGSGTTGSPSTTNIGGPYGLTLDSTNNLYVTDYDNNRVLYYASGSTTATRVYGQFGSFSTNVSDNNGSGVTGSPSADNVSTPSDVSLDSSNNLYIADSGNNRVLYYTAVSTTATRVYGQGGSFTSSSPGISSTGLSNPTGLAVDSGGNLYVVNTTSSSIFYFPSATTTATRVYGQGGSFTTGANNGGISPTSLSAPRALRVASNGTIYVTDNGNNRVLKFQTSLNITTQPPANPVAQAAFSTAATLIDVGSGGIFSDFTGTVSVAIRTGAGTSGAVLSGTTSVSASSGVATFSNLSINLSGAGYILALSSPGIGSNTTNAFAVVVGSPPPSGYWKLDDGSGTTASDSSSNNNPGTLNGTSWTTGKVNGALSFNGSTDYVSMGTPAALKFGTGSFTVMSWFKTTVTSYERIVGTGVSGYSTGFFLAVNMNGTCSTGCVGMELGGGSKLTTLSFGTTATTFNDGNWHQAAMIIDQSAKTAQFYVDGVAQALVTQTGTCGTASGTSVDITACSSLSATNSTDPFVLGAYRTSGGVTSYTFTGSIDEVRVYNSALNNAQIQNQYTIDTTPILNGYWPLDEGSGTTTADLSGNNNPGTITGASWITGKVKGALSFNGSTNYVSMGTPAALKFGTGSFTVMSWFKTTDTGFGRIVGTGVSNYSTGFDLGVNTTATCSAGCVGVELGGGTKAATISFGTTATTFNNGNWHQAAMIIDQSANTAQLYVDGVAQALVTQSGTCGTASGTSVDITACSSTSATNSTDPFTLGTYRSSGGTNGYYFTGSIDEVRVYSGALSSTQVQSQYTNDTTTLSESAANASFSATVGSTATYTLPISLTYQLTPAPGWSISITSTTLTSGANTLPTTASNITSVTGTCVTNWTCTSNTLINSISSFPMVLPTGTTAPTAVKFFSTAVGTGTGAYTVTPTVSVNIPITAKTGAYSSVVTLTAAVGP